MPDNQGASPPHAHASNALLATLWQQDDAQTRATLLACPEETLKSQAHALCLQGHGRLQSWSPKIFIPLTQLCQDRCHYCTFAHPPRADEPAYLSREQVLSIARQGAAAGCTEALFTLGDKPELRWPQARAALDAMGYDSTISYLVDMCAAVLSETGLLPHVNAGVMGREDLQRLRSVSVSQGLMLEGTAAHLMAPGGPHYRSPDKDPALRLETIAQAGEAAIPFTSGILIGIGENRAERLDALLALRALHRRYGHIQEIIIQNFRAKARTAMHNAPEPSAEELHWTIAAARLLFGPHMHIQAPPNLSPGMLEPMIAAGINDWGGVSPVTPDHVNPEAQWPDIAVLQDATENAGKQLVRRLPIYPAYVRALDTWVDKSLHSAVRHQRDSDGWARDDAWAPGLNVAARWPVHHQRLGVDADIQALVRDATVGAPLEDTQVVQLFAARDVDFAYICEAANAQRKEQHGDVVSYVVNRNINYTNICTYRCGFCAFSKGRTADTLRGTPYDLDTEEVVRRAQEAAARGASEVCMQGGIHPHYTGETYLELLHAVRKALPDMHIHAFSPLEIWQGSHTLGLPLADYLRLLKEAGLGSLPGTAAEILDDEVRAIICPDKINTQQWLEVIETAHEVGLRTTATIMFGHIEEPIHWARHLRHIRTLQMRTGGFTEFVPLPFVHMEAPMARKGHTRLGPTLRETLLMHAIARLTLAPHIPNIQASWVKLGPDVLRMALQAGVNDVGGSLMNESISRAAGTQHGQEMPPWEMDSLIHSLGRTPRQRTTLYGDVHEGLRQRGLQAAPLTPMQFMRTDRPAPHRNAAE